MKINFKTYRHNYYLSRPFAGRSQLSEEEIAKEYKSIENAITLIKENPQYPLSLHTICDITKLSYATVNNRLHSSSASGRRMMKLWYETLYERKKADALNGAVSEKQNSKLEIEDYEKIIQAIHLIMENDEYRLTQAQIAKLTNLPVSTLSYRLRENNSYTYEISKLWSQARLLKEKKKAEAKEAMRMGYTDTIKRHKEENIKNNEESKKQKAASDKLKQYKKAIKIINDTLLSQSRLSYKELESKTGLTRQEIDTLIQRYAKYKADKSSQESSLKEMQSKWYKENILGEKNN